MSLKIKYAVLTCLLLMVVLGFSSWRNYLQEEADLRADHQERVALLAEVIKNGLVTSMLEGRGREFQKFLEAMVAKEVKEVRIFSETGKILASSMPGEVGKHIYEEDMARYRNQVLPSVFSHERDDGQEYYSMVLPIYNEPKCQQCHGSHDEVRGVLDVEVSMGRTAERLQRIGVRAVATFVLSVFALAGGLFVLTTLLVDRPLSAIMRTMRSAEEGDLSVRHEAGQNDEIGKLAASLNGMLEKLELAYRELEAHHVQELRKVERMATLGQLASAVAHEIKNPLAGISGAVQVLADDLPPEDSRQGIIQEVLGEISRLDKSVRDLLAYARPAPPYPILAGVEAVLERTLSILGPEARERGVIITTDVFGYVPDTMIDPDQIQQVFMNLIKNAYHSVVRGQGRINIAIQALGDHIQVRFTDNGRGIPEGMRENIFQPFFTTKRAGTGLGLAISKGIVEKHDGTISVEEAPGGGTKFIVELPITGGGDHGQGEDTGG